MASHHSINSLSLEFPISIVAILIKLQNINFCHNNILITLIKKQLIPMLNKHVTQSCSTNSNKNSSKQNKHPNSGDKTKESSQHKNMLHIQMLNDNIISSNPTMGGFIHVFDHASGRNTFDINSMNSNDNSMGDKSYHLLKQPANHHFVQISGHNTNRKSKKNRANE